MNFANKLAYARNKLLSSYNIHVISTANYFSLQAALHILYTYLRFYSVFVASEN